MSPRAARILFWGFFLTYTIALTFPGVLPFNRIRPFVLGLPFAFAWVALWVALGFVVFVVVDRAEGRHRRHGPEPGEDGGPG